jgi:FkbM family methyltransferase
MSNKKEYYSQSGQDQFLDEHVFKGKRDGFYLDIGANDGINLSNTYYFEKNLKWNGICVEPIPNVFSKLKKNRSSVSLNCCISEVLGEVNFMSISGYSEMLSGIYDKYDERHLARIENEIKSYGGSFELMKISSITIDYLLNKYSISNIDYCSIDTEGGEFEIIKQFDFNKINVKCISIENNYNDERINKYLTKNKYKLVKVMEADEIYVKESKQSLWGWIQLCYNCISKFFNKN